MGRNTDRHVALILRPAIQELVVVQFKDVLKGHEFTRAVIAVD